MAWPKNFFLILRMRKKKKEGQKLMSDYIKRQKQATWRDRICHVDEFYQGSGWLQRCLCWEEDLGNKNTNTGYIAQMLETQRRKEQCKIATNRAMAPPLLLPAGVNQSTSLRKLAQWERHDYMILIFPLLVINEILVLSWLAMVSI